MVEVVLGALVRDSQVLLVHRRPDKRAYPDLWDLPGGVREDGESELAALRRELREELGVQVDTDSATLLCRAVGGPADEPARLSAWLVREWHGIPLNDAPDEHDQIGWFGLPDLPPPAHPDVRAALVDAMRTQARDRPPGTGGRT